TASVAEAVKVTAMPEDEPAETVMSEGTVIAGAVVSRTSTSKGVVVVLWAVSWAVQVTVVWPRAKVVAEAGAQAAATVPSTRSVALGVVWVAVAPFGPVASATTSACAVIAG